MTRQTFVATMTFVLISCVSMQLAYAIERGGGGGQRSAGRQSPGGSWSERSHQGGEGHKNYDQSAAQQRNVAPTGVGGQTNRRSTSTSTANNAAAGAAASKRNEPAYSGTQGAAAGAAAANRRNPQYSGAEGAAAGAAAANRNQPNYSGAQGAAAGAAAANNRQPQYSGAQGAVAGAAAANRNQPTYSGAQGAAAGAVAASRNAPAMSGAAGAAVGSAAVRNSFNNYNLYGSQWAAAHPEAWAPAGYAAGSVWAPTNWNAVSGYIGANTPPTWYDYGQNVTYQNGNIMMAGQNLGTAEEFSQQAADLAESGAAAEPPADSDWLPLGVFAMVRNEQQHPQLIMQLAINKQGQLRGNFTDELTEHTQPVRGAYDPKTQRAAWIVGDHKTAIMEAGLSNLAEGDAPALIHKNGQTDHWLLVRLNQPSGDQSAPAPVISPQ